MALECILVYETEMPVPFTVGNTSAIPKGSILTLSDPMTVAITTGDTDVVAGIAAEEKIASDGKTKIAVYRRGIFKGFAGAGGVVAGNALITDTATGAANELAAADINSENIVGRALETALDTESFLFELMPFTVNLA
uniref:Head decoration protein n=1 Tax=viral metagenome TaxID=1070528 RepID=A0A6M3XHG7_9ZZZZ